MRPSIGSDSGWATLGAWLGPSLVPAASGELGTRLGSSAAGGLGTRLGPSDAGSRVPSVGSYAPASGPPSAVMSTYPFCRPDSSSIFMESSNWLANSAPAFSSAVAARTCSSLALMRVPRMLIQWLPPVADVATRTPGPCHPRFFDRGWLLHTNTRSPGLLRSCGCTRLRLATAAARARRSVCLTNACMAACRMS